MNEQGRIFIMLGAMFLLGLAAEAIGRRTRVPRVTLLVILGFIVGPEGLDVLPEGHEIMFNLAANIALTMVGFLLGERVGNIVTTGGGKEVFAISLSVVLVTAVVVGGGLIVIGQPLVLALLLGGIATATAPAATTDVVSEMKAKGPFSRLLLAVVAVDDAWGLLLFSLLLSVAGVVAGNGAEAWQPIRDGLWETGGALGVGGLLGVAMAYLTGRILPGEPTRLEAIGFVFLLCGLALFLEVSFILAAMAMGAVVALLAKHHEKPFHVIKRIEVPFMILFFLLAGASLKISSLASVGLAGGFYILLRMAGRFLGGWLGGKLGGASQGTRRWIGTALMPQAGVAIGMALLAAEQFPQYSAQLLQITIGATVLFEIAGPMMTRLALLRADHQETVAPEDSVSSRGDDGN